MNENQTTEFGNHVTPEPVPAPGIDPGMAKAPKGTKGKLGTKGKILVGVAGFAVAFCMGAATGTTKEVVREVPGPVQTVKGETTTTTVTETPESCLELIDHFQTMLGITADYIDLIPRAADAGMKMSSSATDLIGVEMDDLNGRIEDLTVPVQTATAECRAGSN